MRYELIFGLLTGNSNIVKVPSKKFKQIDFICSKINELLKKKYKSEKYSTNIDSGIHSLILKK